MTTYILTYTGKKLDFADPQPEQIDLMDIFIGLSREGRFANQCQRHYTVAQHSCLVADLVESKFKLEALMHDAHEAYMRDVPSPLKRLIPEYSRIADRLDAVIRGKFSLPLTMSPEVKHADTVALLTEARDLIPHATEWTQEFNEKADPMDIIYLPWGEALAHVLFSNYVKQEMAKC